MRGPSQKFREDSRDMTAECVGRLRRRQTQRRPAMDQDACNLHLHISSIVHISEK